MAENLSGDKLTSATTVPGSLKLSEANYGFTGQTRDISLEPTGEEIHYIVSEVMTDDAARSTAPPEDRDIEIVSVADDEVVELISCIIEEPVTEGRLTEVCLCVLTLWEILCHYSTYLLQEPSERGADERSSAGVLDVVGETDDDNGPGLLAPETNSNISLSGVPEREHISLEEVHSSRDKISRAMTPLMATDEDDVFAVNHRSQAIGSVTTELTERQDNGDGVNGTFPMPVLADPTAPDPIDISKEFILRGDSPISAISGDLLNPVVVALDFVDGTQTLATNQLASSDIFSGQDSSFISSTSGLYEPQDDTLTIPEIPGTLLVDPDVTADTSQLMDKAEADLSMPPIPGASSIPLYTMDTPDVQLISTNAPPAASMDTGSASILSPRIASPTDPVEREEDPFKLMGTDSKVAPGPVDSESSSDGSKPEEQPSDEFVRNDDQ